MKKLVLMVLLFVIGVVPVFANFSSSATFNGRKANPTPSGSGMIYVYHAKAGNLAADGSGNDKKITDGSNPDLLPTSASIQWTAVENGSGGSKIDIGSDVGEYGGDGFIYSSQQSGNTALYVYFFAKPNPGYRFLGWSPSESGATSFISGSNRVYTKFSNQAKKQSAPTYTIWNNGADPAEVTWKPQGYYSEEGYYYLRHVENVASSDNNKTINYYAYFEIIPQLFTFGGTGNPELTYTAQAGSDYTVNVNASDVARISTTDSTSNNITLTLTPEYDTDLYTFVGWYYDYTDQNGVRRISNLIGTTTTATYTLNTNQAAARKNVKIYPRIDDVSDKAALVDFNDSKEFFDTWGEALADALAKSANRGDVPAPTIKLLQDASGINTVQNINQSLTINLNGKKLSGTGSGGILVSIEGIGTEVIISDVKSGQISMTDIATQYTYAISVKKGTSLTINGEQISISNTNTKDDGSARGIEVYGSLSLGGGTISASSKQNAYAIINRNQTTIFEGTVLATTTSAATAVGLLNTTATTATATINGGIFRVSSSTTGASAIQCENGSVTLNEATLEAIGTGTAYCANRTGGTFVVNGGHFQIASTAPLNGAISVRGGQYKVDRTVRDKVADGYNCYELEVGTDYSRGYRYEVTPTQAHPHRFKAVQMNGTTYYETLEDALAYAANESSPLEIIQMVPEYTLLAGNYTLPSYASLVVPKNIDQVGSTLIIGRVDSYTTPSMFKKLTFASGVRMDVFGTIEAGGTQNSNGQGHNGAGVPSGAYGQIELQAGSKVILNNGSRLNAWGFVTGAGEIDARRGSQVYEQFQMFDWKGGKNAGGMLNNTKKVFPVNQYCIQNVEAPTTFHPGSALTAMTSIYVSGSRINCDVVKIVGVTGSGAMFLMDEMDDSENTWVRKYYDVENDKQVYAVNSSAHLGSMIINMEGVPVIGDLNFDSRNYTLPITSNLKIHLLDGYMDITQSTVMIPGAEIEIDKTSTVTINSGQSLYLYDAAEWNKYVFSSAYAQPVLYTPSAPLVNNRRTPTARPGSWVNSSGWWYTLEKPASASINVHGTFDVQGALYTTESGANIFSTNEDAGTVYFSKNAPEDDKVSQPISYTDGTITNTPVYEDKTCVSAKLKNEDGYTTTKGVAKTGDSYCYIQDAWRNLKTDGCFVYETTEEGIIYYAKPSDYVALANGKEENADHTYSSEDKSRTFILVGDCQWWEVIYLEESGLYYCAKNDTYYFYDDSDPEPEFHEWKEKVFSVTWLNWNGVQIEKYNNIRYGSMPNYLGSTPKREKDDYYTYDYSAWSPALSPVISDVTYTAQYERKDRKYTITWKDESGNTIVADYFSMGQIPACSKTVDLTGKEWNPAVSAVTGDATYQLKEKNVNGPFDIKFFNWDGAQIGTTQSVAKNTIPTPPASSPVKPAIADVRFIFTGWSPEVVAATANASYTAMFEEQPITYTITWKNWNGTILKTDEVAPKVVPQYTGTTPTKAEDANNIYVFNSWTPEIAAATEDAIYTATYTAVPKDMEVSTSQTLPASAVTTVTNMIVHSSGTLTVPNTATLKAANLILEATGNTSGQVIVNPGYESRLQIAGTAYFDLTLNTPARHWHAFGVPWRVDIAATPLKEVETGRTLTLGRDYDIIYYNGTKRASQGPGAHCWEYVEDNGKTLTPGQGYMIAFTSAVQTVRFTKAAGAPIIFNGSNSVTGGTGDNGGWNAIANPMAYHATLNAGPTVGYVHDGGEIGSDGYVPYDIDNKKYIVGKAVYVQASSPATVAVAAAGNKGVITPVAAPARRAKTTGKTYLSLDDYYRVSLADAAGKSGSVYVLPEEDKADQYVIGHDLSQFGMNAAKPQLWINRYGTQLALNTTAPVDGVAEFPMSLYAPKDGEYTIRLQSSDISEQESETLYLTKDGEVIWNLSDGACTLTLAKGTTANYGLRLGEKKAPEVATGFGEAVVDAHGKTTKVLIDGKVFIIREDRVYSIDGQLVK